MHSHYDGRLNAPDLGMIFGHHEATIFVLRRPGLPPITATTLAFLIAYLHAQPLCIYEIEMINGDIRSLLVSTLEANEARNWRNSGMTEVAPHPVTGELEPIERDNVTFLKFGAPPRDRLH